MPVRFGEVSWFERKPLQISPNEVTRRRARRPQRDAPVPDPREPPLRAELFSVGQLTRHARAMAGWHDVVTGAPRGADQLLARLGDNEVVLREAYALITQAVHRGRQITPAAEWFIDNYPLVEEQIRTARRHLPRAYNRELPRLANAAVPGTPRVHAIALELISHAHGRVDGESLRAFVAAYQAVQPLRLGELWAIPIMLRLALLENLRRVVSAITAGRRDRERALEWFERLRDVTATDPPSVVLVLADLVDAAPALSDAFVAELAALLRGQGAAMAFPLAWLEQRLAELGQTADLVFERASQSQAADQVSISNSIGSLRFLITTDWREFVESTSAVEGVLRDDPARIYATMDFATRDRYRHAVEHVARYAAVPEVDVARAAIALATGGADRAGHVGHWLIAGGRPALERAVHMRRPLGLRARRGIRRARHLVYGGAIVTLTAALAVLLAWLVPLGVGGGVAVAVAWGAALTLGASQLAIGLVHWAATMLVCPTVWSRLDFTAGMPAAHRTLVAVPTMLTDAAEIDELLGALEVRFLANRDPQLGFALVTDFRDAVTEHVPGDDALVEHARAGIDALNARHDGHGGFFLFHRPRRWNPSERLWMGWERKRGKLEELNDALRGDRARFTTVVGPLDRLAGVQYVVALDSDTTLPRDSARLLAATLAHPLNRPRFDAARGRVTAGYAILQPRVGVSVTSTGSSRFARLFGGEPGIDPYTRAVSDVYQDVFDEGSFVGKGIYDVDAVRLALRGRLPENRVLSHDLLEGAYARAGLVSDVLLIEDHPSTHGADVNRRHRWIRGDWQIVAWLRRRVPGASARVANPISVLSQWKVLDNLRRSVVPLALLGLLLVGWTRPGAALAATLAVTAIVILPGLVAVAAALLRRPADEPRGGHLRDLGRRLIRQLGREGFALACLPFEAALAADAIVRTVVRVLLTGRPLLQWRTAADAQRAGRAGMLGTVASMWINPLAAVAIAIALARLAPAGLVPASPMLALWALAPLVAWWLSTPLVPPRPQLSAVEREFLDGVARQTWRFFETFVGPEDNYLPPDNVQEDPPRGAAHRTSPTNIGLALTASLAAYDFGYITVGDVVTRTTRTLATLERMERHRGHFYNWYDTTTLAPLRPMYVSTVDSGNLAGHLLILAAGLDELATAPLVRPQVTAGLASTLAGVAAAAAPTPAAGAAIASLRAELADGTATTITLAAAQLDRLVVLADALADALADTADAEPRWWAHALAAQCRAARAELAWMAPPVPAEAIAHGAARVAELQALAARCRALADLDYDFLYEPTRHLLSIGYNVTEHQLDPGYYDLLASEARLASFIAIAQGKLPQEHWFSLGRLLTASRGRSALVSWSGSMFEYLMPLLVMPTYPATLLDETYHAVVERQIDYGRERGVPWGVSESGYNKTDAQLNYQYRAFGVPGLGFKRGLADDLVIAPYASAMALMVAPHQATANLQRLVAAGHAGVHGFYEAIDYTAARLPPGTDHVTVRSYMAHHQGMALLALAYVLLDRPMQRRFAADPAFRATELLLQERVPRGQAINPHPAEVSTSTAAAAGERGHELRVFTTPSTPTPEVHLLSNGSYHLAITNAGGGYSRWRDVAVTRWHEDATRDCWGTFGYLRDVDSGAFWSVAHQPTLVRASHYEAIYSQGRAEFRRSDGDVDTHVEISVSPEDDVELRRVTLTNRGRTPRTIELTSFAEVVLTQAAADAAHPAFSNLFVQTELVRAHQAILATRRPRSGGEHPPWLVHLMTIDGTAAAPVSYETDRAAFLGRGRTVADPLAMYRDQLGDSEGSVLDPIVAIRGRVVIAPDQVVRLHVATGVAESRDGAMRLIEKYRDQHAVERVLALSWTHSQVVQRRLEASNLDTQLFDRLASSVLYGNPTLRAPRGLIARNRGGQAGLWPYAISGDLPIILVRIADVANLDLVRQLVKAHAYWRRKGLAADLVIWNEDPSGYRQVLQDEIMAVIGGLADVGLHDRPGGIFVRRSEQIAEHDKVLMQTVARVIVSDADGTLADHLDRRPRSTVVSTDRRGHDRRTQPEHRAPSATTMEVRTDLLAWNGHGGFTPDGREYVIATTRDACTPAPWVNVLANPWFGTVISESGSAYTWCENAHSYRLSPWHNDAVTDASGEAFYLRDEDDGRYWSPTPLPAGADGSYTSRHGFGYSVFETTEAGIASTLTTYVATDAPVKFIVIKLRNVSGRRRALSLTGYVELVLGASRAGNAPHVVTEVDPGSRALLARNAYNTEFAARIAFLDCSEWERSITGDRTAFLGRNGSLARPAALRGGPLPGQVGAALDPCLAMQTSVELADGQEREVAFMLGSGQHLDDARHLVHRFRGTGPAHDALERVWDHWKRTLGAVQIRTEEPTVDLLANGWLLYQVIACRMWGRSGFYQSGGAYGFRDQLQDAMALIHADPGLYRAQLLTAAARQFPPGDVQHWWHPPLGRGVRTHISDDYLWLPYATCRYVASIGDTGVLDEVVGFLEGRPVKEDEDSYYDLPAHSEERASLYEHCVRAIRNGLAVGVHGLPLMGSGDWNDGMNLVGEHGRGESVWLAFFLHDVLRRFGELARRRNDLTFAETCAAHAGKLREAIEASGWDGEWYRRAYFDDGTPLGSATNAECQIDSLPQSWAVLSGAAEPARATRALAALDQRLVRRDLGLIQLFDPPFDTSELRPGYIKGYVPGVRENGGQYTHAAVWATMAFAAAGDSERAWELLRMINPVAHGDSAAAIATYKVEPYVVAADVYTNPQHAGRGGWTWYTGSAGWMYRLVLESLLGLRLDVDRLWIEPRIPASWTGFEVHYRHRETVYHIHVRTHRDVARVICDGVDCDGAIPLRDDRQDHHVIVDLI